MVLHFNCPETGKPFETADYSISDNRGVMTNANGDKILDATVMINSPCPHCGNLHKYRADKLACPFSLNPDLQTSKIHQINNITRTIDEKEPSSTYWLHKSSWLSL
jgi:predicted RNA-binding Zn-ribbon protein involved in translation (DUF1610 family)